MNNIDKILKEAIHGFEAPFDSTMWDKLSSQLSPMEDAFRETLENHEAPHNPKAWSSIKNKIGSSWSLTQWIGGTAAAIAVVATAIVFWPTTESSLNEDVNLALTVDNDSVNNNKATTLPVAVSDNEDDKTENQSVPSESLAENQVHQESSAAHSATTFTNTTPPSIRTDKDSTSSTRTLKPDFDELILPEEAELHESTVALNVNAEFKASAYNVCAGATILFNPQLSKAGTNHIWDFGDGSIITGDIAKHTFTKAGNFRVTHTVRDNKTNAILATESQSLTVNALPSAQITWNQPLESVPSINFSSATNGSDEVLWSIDGNIVSDKATCQQTLRQKGEHVIELAVTNAQGCNQSSQEIIEIEEDYNLFAPTVFTPNGDGNNDQFIPVALTLLDKQFEMFIYDIEGHLLYQTNNANNAWDGRDVRTHVESEEGVYVWFVTLINENGEQEIYRGQVLLAR